MTISKCFVFDLKQKAFFSLLNFKQYYQNNTNLINKLDY